MCVMTGPYDDTSDDAADAPGDAVAAAGTDQLPGGTGPGTEDAKAG